MRLVPPLLALAIGTFGIGTTEFAPMGLLPGIARSLDVSIPTAGQLVTAYAIGVMVGAPLMTLLLARLRRRAALVVLLAVFTLGNLCSALAPGYDSLLAARVLTALAHGAFFGLGSVEAASLVAPDRRASAVATMLMGLTIANVGGVPAATFLGHLIGWRPAFLAIGALGLVAIAALLAALPPGERGARPAVRRELRAMARLRVQGALATTSLASAAMFTLYTYVAAVLVHVTHAGAGLVTLVLAVTGLGFTAGNWLGGRAADRGTERSLTLFLLLLTAVLLVFPFTARTPVGAVLTAFVWGLATFAVVPSLQLRVMDAARDAPGLGASVNIGAFNFGNALGAAMGGAVLSLGLGYPAVPMAGAVFCVAAVLVVRLSGRFAPSRPETHPAPVVSGAQ